MIKVAVYMHGYQLENDSPEYILTLKEFEDKYDHDLRYDVYAVRFIVA
jgi:hypothetical protein